MSERTREERIEDYYQGSAWDLAEYLVDAEDEAARLRSAWTSARRRAADAYNFGGEALALRDEEIARLRAELTDLRKTFCGAPSLECVGTEEDGSTVWQMRRQG
jgi:hypothetical protein